MITKGWNPCLTDGEKATLLDFTYGSSFYGENLPDFARIFARAIDPKINAIASVGSSGCAIASGVLCFRPMNHIHIHHKGAVSAHREYEKLFSGRKAFVPPLSPIAIVDDLIHHGNSILRAIEHLLFSDVNFSHFDVYVCKSFADSTTGIGRILSYMKTPVRIFLLESGRKFDNFS